MFRTGWQYLVAFYQTRRFCWPRNRKEESRFSLVSVFELRGTALTKSPTFPWWASGSKSRLLSTIIFLLFHINLSCGESRYTHPHNSPAILEKAGHCVSRQQTNVHLVCVCVCLDSGSISSGFTPISSSFPVGAIPLIVTSSPAYQEQVAAMVMSANCVYQDFLRSEEGLGFRGEVRPAMDWVLSAKDSGIVGAGDNTWLRVHHRIENSAPRIGGRHCCAASEAAVHFSHTGKISIRLTAFISN